MGNSTFIVRGMLYSLRMSLCMERGGRYGFGNEKPNQLDPPDIVAQRRGDFIVVIYGK